MNKSGIEWCDHTWNPITGCRHGCSYCYADKMSLRFCGNMKRNMVQTDQYRMEGDLFVLDKPFMNEDRKPVIYPFGFEPTLHRYRYDTLDKLKQGQNVFVGAMADIFGEWVPDSWIDDILGICEKHCPVSLSSDNYYEFSKEDLLRDNWSRKPAYGKVDPTVVGESMKPCIKIFKTF